MGFISLIEIFKEDLFTRERIEAIDNTENSFGIENPFTARTLANHSYKNTRLDKSGREKQVSVYCHGKNYISTRCVNVKNVETRKNILKVLVDVIYVLIKIIEFSIVKSDMHVQNVR